MTPQLTMPMFVDPVDAVDRMQLDAGVTGVLAEVNKAIMRAELFVQALVDGSLIRQTLNSMYFTDSEAFSGMQPNGVFRLELPSGFIRRDTPVSVQVSALSQQNYLSSLGVNF